MRRFKPIHGVLLVVLFVGAILVADLVLEGRFGGAAYQRVTPDRNGTVRIDVSDLQPRQVRFYRFLNPGNQEVKFLVGRDAEGHIQVGFDASETHGAASRGFKHDGDWLVDKKCETTSRLSEVNEGRGGCRPVPVRHRVVGDELVLAENDILQGWRFFR